MKKELVIVNTKQFSYHTDTYKYCKYLNKSYSISYFCIDQGKKKQDLKEVNVFYQNDSYTFFFKELKFILSSYFFIKTKSKNAIVFLVYNRFSFLLNLLLDQKIILDIRTASVKRNKYIRYFEDLILKFNVFFFKEISIISHALAKKLKIKKYKLLPLGSDVISNSQKDYNRLRLLYVGTLYNRNIHLVLDSIKIVYETNQNIIESFNIFGSGSKEEENLIMTKISDYGLSKTVFFHGHQPHKNIKYFFDYSNIGISFIPITSYFDFQPPTKTFEYIMSGLFCIGTATYANKEIINSTNGIVSLDDPISFSNAIIEAYNNRANMDFEIIKNSLSNYSWDSIINNNLVNLIED
tara:strand:+ start:3017 stop:4072 length:1056 start_codon:yes stop_codon:yes gene_type:complete